MGEKVLLEQTHQATGCKVFLALMEDSHIRNLIKLARDPSLIDLMGWDTFFELDATEEFIEGISLFAFSYSRKSQPIVFGVYLDVEELPVGYAILKGLNTELRTAEFGIAILDKKYRNQGYGKLASSLLIHYAFNELGLQIIAAAVLVSNKRSLHMFERLGFAIRETWYRSWLLPNGDMADMLWMELKSETWKF